jgi:hypothetical protein
MSSSKWQTSLREISMANFSCCNETYKFAGVLAIVYQVPPRRPAMEQSFGNNK